MKGESASSVADTNESAIWVVICGFGEIANKSHLPAIVKSNGKFRLAAIVEPNRQMALERLVVFSSTYSLDTKDISVYTSLPECLSALKDSAIHCDAVSVCTPLKVTLDLAQEALEAGKHVMVEKPPGDWRKLQSLEKLAERQHVTLFTAYHTAACVGLDHIKQWLQKHSGSLESVQVNWKESVRKWHPGQTWVTQKNPIGNFCEGVLEMVFNPLSLLVAVLGRLEFMSSRLVIPSNWETPISGEFKLVTSSSNKKVSLTGSFAWDYEPETSGAPEEIWTMTFHATTSTMHLEDGGSQVYVDGHRITTQPTAEYQLGPEYGNLYRQFSTLIANKACAVDDITPRLLQQIQEEAVCDVGPPYQL